MTHPVLIRLEELVNFLSERMRSNEEDLDPELINAAREYAEACGAANARLQTCLDILSKGRDKEHQALMAATRQPDLLDSCSVLSELQTEEYSAFCRRNHLPVAPFLNERAKQEVDPLYARAGSFQKKLRMEFSAANSKRDFREALEIARQLAKVDSSDVASAKQAASLEDRLVQEVLTGKILPALDKGDDAAAVAALAEIEVIAPGRQPRAGERSEKVWIEAIAARKAIEKDEAIRSSANLLIQAEAARDADNLESVLEILARLGELMEKHSFDLSEERFRLFGELSQWKDFRLRKARIEASFQDQLGELRVLIKKITDKDFQNTAPTYQENRADALELQRIWKEIAEFKKPVEDELQEKARKVLGELNAKIDRHERAKRRNLLIGVFCGLTFFVVVVVVAMMFHKAGSFADQLLSAQADGRAKDVAKMLATLDEKPPSWRSVGKLPRVESNARTWLEEEKALSARLTGVLSELRNEFETRGGSTGWNPVSLAALKTRLDEAATEVATVNRDDRIPLEDALTSLQITWDGIAGTTRNSIVEEFHAKIKELDRSIREDLGFDLPINEANLRFGRVSGQIGELDSLAAVELEELKPSSADLTKFGVLKERFQAVTGELEKVRTIMANCAAADGLKPYTDALRGLQETSFLTGEQKVALGDLLAVSDSEERLFREILMPGDLIKWKHLSVRTFASDAYPDDIAPEEEAVFLDLRDDETLSEIYLYTISVGGKSRRIYSRGATLEAADLSSGGSQIHAMRGSEVYDPEGASLTTVVFSERQYRLERGPNFTRGAVPTGGSLSPESAFFNSLNLPSYVNSDFSAFGKPFLELAEKIVNAPDDVNPLFRAYLFIKVGKLMSTRPEKWLIDFCQLSEDVSELQSITDALMKSSDWCSAEKTDQLGAEIRSFFAERKNPQYLDRSKAVYGFYARVFTGGLVFSGYLDHEDQIKMPRAADLATTLWGFNGAFEVRPLFRKNDSGQWVPEETPAKFTPLFHLRVNPEITWEEVAKANSLNPSDESLTKLLPAMLGVRAKPE